VNSRLFLTINLVEQLWNRKARSPLRRQKKSNLTQCFRLDFNASALLNTQRNDVPRSATIRFIWRGIGGRIPTGVEAALCGSAERKHAEASPERDSKTGHARP
jgi:hypothetical protein